MRIAMELSNVLLGATCGAGIYVVVHRAKQSLSWSLNFLILTCI